MLEATYASSKYRKQDWLSVYTGTILMCGTLGSSIFLFYRAGWLEFTHTASNYNISSTHDNLNSTFTNAVDMLSVYSTVQVTTPVC